MISCAKCGSSELLVIRTRMHVDFVRRWFGLFGPIVPRLRLSTLDLACSICLYAFVADSRRVIEAPMQQAYEQLRAAQIERINGPPSDGKDAPPAPRNVARPAGDPRVKQRR